MRRYIYIYIAVECLFNVWLLVSLYGRQVYRLIPDPEAVVFSSVIHIENVRPAARKHNQLPRRIIYN